jgi:hypothetical protein
LILEGQVPLEDFMSRIMMVVVIAVLLTSTGLFAQELGPDKLLLITDGGAAIIIATSQSGKTLYGYSVYTGTWDGVTVIRPDTSPLEPVVSAGIGYVMVGKRIHAFSAKTGLWATVELPAVATPRLSVGDRLRVDVGSKIYMYSGPAGKWAILDLAADK